jgi:hypothetical protein
VEDELHDYYRNADQHSQQGWHRFDYGHGRPPRQPQHPQHMPHPYGPTQMPHPYGQQQMPHPYGSSGPPPQSWGHDGAGSHPSQHGHQSRDRRAIGRVIRALTPLVVALLPLPSAPTPIAPSGDPTTDQKASLANEANAIAYQTAIAQSVKRDETVFALGEGIGILVEKGLS